MDEPINSPNLKQYLRGDLSAEENLAIERRFLDDEGFEAELLAVEQEWIDSYVAGEMNAAEGKAFRRWMTGHPDRVQRVRLAKTFFQVANPDAPPVADSAAWTWRSLLPQAGLNRYAVAFAALLVVASSTVWIVHRTQFTPDAKVAGSNEESVVGAGVFPKRPAGLPAYTSVLLRAEQTAVLEILAPVELVSLQMELPGQARERSLNAQLLTAAGEIVWQAKGMAGEALDARHRLSLWIPASQLKEGIYTIRVESNGVRRTFQLRVHRG